MAAIEPKRIPNTAIETTPCPNCGEETLHLESRMTTSPIGTFSLSGMSMKFSASVSLWIKCDNCGVEAQGHA